MKGCQPCPNHMTGPQLTIRFPQGYEVIGFMYASDDHAVLSEDMLEVQLPSGVLVYAGWYAEGRIEGPGAYRVVASRDLENLERRETQCVYEALKWICQLVSKYAEPAP